MMTQSVLVVGSTEQRIVLTIEDNLFSCGNRHMGAFTNHLLNGDALPTRSDEKDEMNGVQQKEQRIRRKNKRKMQL